MEFGTKIEFVNHLKRVRVGEKRKWISQVFKYENDKNNIPKPAYTKGIVIGVRTLWNGHVIYESIDEGYAKIFIFEKSIKAYLVAVNLKDNPIYVLEEDLLI